MAQVTLREILDLDIEKGAIGAFNVHNLEFIQGVILAAEREQAPVVMMINEAVLKYGQIPILGGAAVAAARHACVPVAVMVDHGTDGEFLEEALRFGLDVMFDGSALSFEKNIARTKRMADYAHALGRSLEGEIGALGFSEDGEEAREQKITTVKEAVIFAEKSGVDVLAVSVGNVHGFYRGTPHIRVDRIAEIHQKVQPIPIVMHGGSDIPDEIIQASIRAGIRKFNIATDLKFAYAKQMKELLSREPMPIQPLQIFPTAAEAVAKIAQEKIKKFRLEV